MILVGITAITSKKNNQKLMKLAFVDDTPSPNRVGSDVSTDFCNYNEDYLSLVGEEIEVRYKKGYDGRAIIDYLERKEE